MRIFSFQGSTITETDTLPTSVPDKGHVWIACARSEFEQQQAQIQATLQRLTGLQLVDLHISDLLNQQLPSHYDYTSQYDLLVFRRLATRPAEAGHGAAAGLASPSQMKGGPPVLHRIDTSPVGFALFDQVLLTVHPADCSVREAFASRLLQTVSGEARPTGARLPSHPADLMLRLVNQMVDGYLELRRELTRQLDHWQNALLKPRTRFNNWSALLQARLALHHLDEICEDQRAAIQDWIDALETWPDAQTLPEQRERDLLKVRSRDVLEHIERVVHHVRRLEQSAETAVQMHFSAQSNRTNDIMRTLTALTAVFLPLNLIAGIFGMNFEFIPLIHLQNGFWWAMGTMGVIALVLIVVFWRKQYLARTQR
ncbi:magnesium transporter CorA family protein [Curvibacter sp. HBC61]|uniref:Magnesium transporter CorA family protein n=1 Tax=Curvibacter cyanobacteriorum TaxID=3026422 RepID=A0ABT5N2S6_9BURK|nr:magnesium transporter CorA family protein [Curvibacter sp. HBC61]MDD0840425.1 magnesium transporter CorA family protein [Curvibacter sp. HBC61]